MIKNNGCSLSKEHETLIAQSKLVIPLINVSSMQPHQKGSIMLDPRTEIFYISHGHKWTPVITELQPSRKIECIIDDEISTSVSVEDFSIIFTVKNEQKAKINEKGIFLIGTNEADEGNISQFQGNVSVKGDLTTYSIIFEKEERLYVEDGELYFSNKYGDTCNISNSHPKILNSGIIYKKNYNTSVGKKTIQSDYGHNNTSLGAYSLQYVLSFNNTGIGAFSLQNTTSGTDNVGLGYFSLNQNISGSYNTALGSNSSSKNGIGSYNTSIGRNSLRENTIGNYNTVIGCGVLGNAVCSNSNIAVGLSMMNCKNPGIQNIAIGQKTLDSENFTGTDNVLIGTNCGKSLENGNQNIAIGASALDQSVTSNSNIAIGANSLGNVTNSSEQIAIGTDSLMSNISGSNNVSIGTRCMSLNLEGNGNVGLGNESLQFNINGNDNTSLGTYSMFSNESGSSNVSVGKESLQNIKSGNFNTSIGKGAGDKIVCGENNIFLGESASSSKDVSGCIVIGNGGCATEDDQLVLCGKMSGIAKLVDGIACVSCSNITLHSKILLTAQFIHGVPGFLYISDRTEKTNFIIKSSSGYDNSEVAYFIFES